MAASVTAVSCNPKHGFSKQPQARITLLAGLGVEGDAHCGATVQHLYLKRRHADAPNRMQVHLLAEELLDELAQAGFAVLPGGLGENITTRGVDLCLLPQGTRLRLGSTAVVELTGLRTPCSQIDKFMPGLLKQVVDRDRGNRMVAKAGVMAIVLAGGTVQPGEALCIDLPAEPHVAMQLI